MSDTLRIYNRVRQVPQNAQKSIQAGRLKGMTDINPMWRIKTLTEVFGPCGIGWHPEIVSREIVDGSDGQKVAIVDVNLYIREGEEWSRPIPGTGGSMLIANERNGAYTSDEAFKMAYTDALSVCCKLLGIGADVYWQADGSKYSAPTTAAIPEETEPPCPCEACGKMISDAKNSKGEIWKAKDIAVYSKLRYQKRLCVSCMNKESANENNG